MEKEDCEDLPHSRDCMQLAIELTSYTNFSSFLHHLVYKPRKTTSIIEPHVVSHEIPLHHGRTIQEHASSTTPATSCRVKQTLPNGHKHNRRYTQIFAAVVLTTCRRGCISRQCRYSSSVQVLPSSRRKSSTHKHRHILSHISITSQPVPNHFPTSHPVSYTHLTLPTIYSV